MKAARIPGTLILSALLIVLQHPGFSQDAITAKEFNPADNLIQGRLISTYREYFKNDLYDMALESWWTIFNEYPDISEKLYVDGVTLYRHFIAETPEGQARKDKIDTLMLIYDQRMAYFGGEGNILGRKGSDLLRYRSSDKEQVLAAYGMLKKSLEIQGTGSRESVILNYISACLILHHAAMIDNSQALEDYFLVTGLLEQQEGRSSRWKRTRASIDEMIQKEGILTCEGLDLHFGPQFEQNSGDAHLLEKVINSYTFAGCTQSDLYVAASEKLYEIDPGPESAHNLAMLFISRNDLEKAAWYLQMAVIDENTANETRAKWFYELSIVSMANGDHCGAIGFAREAIAYRNDYGKAYIALGDAFIACRKQLGDDFQQQSAYWAAADMYQLAARVDPALAEESCQKLAICTAQYPGKEDIFFQDFQAGNNYLVGGCIQENTTVRSRD
jgi:tetratricopeptide (TPR) repeat protein